MTIKLDFEGGKELEKALAQLPRGTAKGVARRAMKKELKPVEDLANLLYPGSDLKVVRTTSRLKRGQPWPKKGASILNMFVGATSIAPHAHLIEWGTGPRRQKTTGRYTGSMPPDPFMQPAWDRYRKGIFKGLGERLWDEISKTIARQAKRKAK